MMLAPPKGNIDRVYRALAKSELRKVKRRATREINQAVSITAKLEAEIIEGESANWYLIQTLPGNDLKAMRYLARRHFGVFRPMQQRKRAKVEGQSIGGMEPTFPGWLFVFCWGIDKMRWRILSAPGVASIFGDKVSLKPIIIPDEFVMRLREEAWIIDKRIGHVAQEGDRHQQRRPPKLGKKERKAIDGLKKSLKLLGKFDPSTWAKAAELAPAKRIALLLQALQGPVVEGGAHASA
jgi:hypothetical protein